MAQILIDYDVLEKEAKEMLNLCDKYNDFTINALNDLKLISQNWQSENSLEFQKQTFKFINSIADDQKYLENFAKIILRISNGFKDDEDTYIRKIDEEFQDVDESEVIDNE